MINVGQAADKLHRKHPNLVITKCVELPEHWLFTAIENPNVVDYDAPFYAVNKKNGSIGFYSPLADFDNFVKAKPVKFK